MTWSVTSDVNVFLGAAGAWLRSRPVEHTMLLSMAEAIRLGAPWRTDDILLGWWHDGNEISGAFLHPAGGIVQVTNLPAVAIVALADELAGRTLAQVNGVSATVDAFAAEWLRRHPGLETQVAMSERLYRLGELAAPPGVPGQARAATAAERDLLIAWRVAFHEEVGGTSVGDVSRAVDDQLGRGSLTLWTVDGAPVAQAGQSRPAGGMVRVGGVFTPPEHRRRGYAAALVAEVSRAARAAGHPEVVLFTDLANPTSNGIYQRTGFRPVQDWLLRDLRLDTKL